MPAINKLKYPEVVDEAISNIKAEYTINTKNYKYKFKTRNPRYVAINSYNELENQISNYLDSLPPVPSLPELIKIRGKKEFSIENLIAISKDVIIDKEVLGFYIHNSDQIAIVIDTVEKSAIELANNLNIEFSRDFFYRFLRYSFLHEMIHCTFDFDFPDSRRFRHLTDSYANFVASKLLPNDPLSRQIIYMKIYYQPKEYGYGLYLDKNYISEKLEELIRKRINHEHEEALSQFYNDVVGMNWYTINPEKCENFSYDLLRLYGYRNIYCTINGEVKILGNVTGLIIANSVGSVTGILPRGSYLITNNIVDNREYKDVSLNNCIQIPKEKLDISEILNKCHFTYEMMRKIHKKVFFAEHNNKLTIENIASIIEELSDQKDQNNLKSIIGNEPITIHGNVFTETTCIKCSEVIKFPYKVGNIISPKNCTFSASVGDDTVRILDGHTILKCPPIENLKNIIITCKCGNIVYSTEDFFMEDEDN